MFQQETKQMTSKYAYMYKTLSILSSFGQSGEIKRLIKRWSMAKGYTKKMDYYPIDVKSIQFEHDYCLNHSLVVRHNKNINVEELNRCGKKFNGNVSAVDKWADSIVLRASTGNDLKSNIERQISILKVKCPFLPEQQIRGKVYKKMGIPTVMGGLSSRGTSFVGGSSSKKRSTACTENPKTTDNLKKVLTSWKVSKMFNKFSSQRATTYDEKRRSIRSNQDLEAASIDYVCTQAEVSNYKIVDFEQFVNPTMLDQLSIEYEPTPFFVSDLQLHFRRVTSPVSFRNISKNPEHHFTSSAKNCCRISDLNGNIIQENEISRLNVNGRKRKLHAKLFPHFIGTNQISRKNHLYKIKDKFIKEDNFMDTNIAVRQMLAHKKSSPDSIILDNPYSKQEWKSHCSTTVSKSDTHGKNVQLTNNEKNYERAGVASKEFLSGNNAMINRNYESNGSQKKINNSVAKERILSSNPQHEDFLGNKENEFPREHRSCTMIKTKNVQTDCHKNAQIYCNLSPVTQVIDRLLLENSSHNERIQNLEIKSLSMKKPHCFHSDNLMLLSDLKNVKSQYESNSSNDCGKNAALEHMDIVDIHKKDFIPKSLVAGTNNNNITILPANLIPCRNDIPTFIVVDSLSNHCCEYDQHLLNVSGLTSFVHTSGHQSSTSLKDSLNIGFQELTESVEAILKFLDINS